MKKILLTIAVGFSLAACVKQELEEYGNAFLQISSVSVGSISTKSTINGPEFPVAEASRGIGLFLDSQDGSPYDGQSQGYRNVKYYYDGHRWTSDNAIMLSASSGRLCGYFPYNESVTDITSVPVASSFSGTDHMYLEPVSEVSAGSRYVNAEMKHALSLVSLKFVKSGEYSGQGVISSITLSGEGIAAKASLNAVTGELKPSGSSYLSYDIPSSAGKITAAGTVEEFLIVPYSNDGKGRTLRLNCTIDGKEYSLALFDFVVSQGKKSEVVINVRNIGLSVAKVSSGQWDNGISLTLLNGRKVRVELMKETFERDILANACSSDNSVIVEGISKSGYPLMCKVPGNVTCTVVEDRGNGFRQFRIDGVASDITVKLGYDLVSLARKDVPEKSFYKDIFLDAGLGLDVESRIPQAIQEMYGAPSRDITAFSQVEVFYTLSYSTHYPEDTLTQERVLCGWDGDLNGSLLYPDGEPRFKLIYVYGGRANAHGESLGARGIDNVNTFYANGGSYSGSCAGCILSCASYGGSRSPSRFDIFDGGNYVFSGMYISNLPYYTDATLVKGTSFDDFSGLAEKPGIDSLRHNGGAYLDESSVPEGTEVLARFSSRAYPEENTYEGSYLDRCVGKPCLWAYKRNEKSGRMVVCGSHPELCNTEDIKSLYKGELLYALDGFGTATAKDALYNGEPRVMNLKEGDPGHCGLGDGQYHNYVIFLPYGASELNLTLEWDSKASLDLALRHDSYAFDNPDYCVQSPRSAASVHSPVSLKAENLEPGMWYVSVYCANKLKGVYKNKMYNGTHTAYWFDYTYTNSEVDLLTLNGVPYTITASWK